jgi:hypothetical protein
MWIWSYRETLLWQRIPLSLGPIAYAATAQEAADAEMERSMGKRSA